MQYLEVKVPGFLLSTLKALRCSIMCSHIERVLKQGPHLESSQCSGNTITSSPYGPHGEHPERWRANGTFPMPLEAEVNRNVVGSAGFVLKASLDSLLRTSKIDQAGFINCGCPLFASMCLRKCDMFLGFKGHLSLDICLVCLSGNLSKCRVPRKREAGRM